MDNILEEYIKICKKEINEYIQIMLKSKFNQKINELYLEKLIDIRYYSDKYISRSEVSDKILEVADELKEQFKLDKELIDIMQQFYAKIPLFDEVQVHENFGEVAEKLSSIREKLINTKTKNMQNDLVIMLKKYYDKKNNLMERYTTEDFKLKNTKLNKDGVYETTLRYNFEFPNIYNKNVINRVYKEGIIAENKVRVTYLLISVDALKTIIRYGGKKEYIVELPDSILKKDKKLSNCLGLIKNSYMQDILISKISYLAYSQNKEKVESLINDGYKFAIILDNTFDYDTQSIVMLQIFSYIIIQNESTYYNTFITNNEKFKNIIIE